jgi:hypothetical protein
MTLAEFNRSLEERDQPPENLPKTLQALWFDQKGDWHTAHGIVQEIDSSDSAWVHAYLHRKEGDPGNARYWYKRAERSESDEDLAQEWEDITETLLAKAGSD